MKNASRDVVTVTTAASDIGVGLTAVFFLFAFSSPRRTRVPVDVSECPARLSDSFESCFSLSEPFFRLSNKCKQNDSALSEGLWIYR